MSTKNNAEIQISNDYADEKAPKPLPHLSGQYEYQASIVSRYSIADAKDNKISNIFSVFKDQFNRTLGLSCFLLVCSSFSHGFDNQGFATIQAMDAFIKQFGEYNSNSQAYSIPTKFLSYLNSFQYIGFAFGLVVGSYVSAYFGRKWCIRSMSAYAVIIAIISVTSKEKEQILSARVLNYVFIGMEMAVLPVFQAEITPAKARGFMVGAFQLSLGIGGLVIHIITNATAHRKGDSAWRIPVGLFFIFPTIVGILVTFIPESPRWLLLQSREEDALESLIKYRKGKFTEEEILAEFESIKSSLKELDDSQGTYKELFQGNNLKRTLIVIGTNIFQQVTGQAFSSQYGTIYIKSLKTVDPFQMSIVSAVIGIVGVILILLLNDKFGRKTFLYIGSLLQIGALMTMGGLGSPAVVSRSMKNGVVAMMNVFGFAFSIGWAPLCYVISSEVPTLKLRDKTYRIGILFNILFAFLVAFTLPYLLNADYANLQSKVGFVYGSFSVLALIFTYLFIPECHGKSLEEIDYCFYKKIPLTKFGSYHPGQSGDYLSFKKNLDASKLGVESNEKTENALRQTVTERNSSVDEVV